jgi:Uncharacterized protein conserved in bacteria
MIITSIEQQKKNHNRYNIYVDGEYYFSTESEDIVEFNIREKNCYDDVSLKELVYKCQHKKALNLAYRELSVRPRSQMEIIKKLKNYEYDDNVIKDVINKLVEFKYIDDMEFAKLWIEDRKRLKAISRSKLMQELKAKGIDKLIINQVLEECCDNDLQAAVSLMQKKINKVDYENYDRNEIQKLYRFLLYKGFSYDTAKKALDTCLKLKDEY